MARKSTRLEATERRGQRGSTVRLLCRAAAGQAQRLTRNHRLHGVRVEREQQMMRQGKLLKEPIELELEARR